MSAQELIVSAEFRDAEREALTACRNAAEAERQTVAAKWRAGTALREVREMLPHGEWMAWQRENGIARSSADRWIRLAEGYAQITHAGNFTSVRAALASLPKPTRQKASTSAQASGDAQQTETASVGQGEPDEPPAGGEDAVRTEQDEPGASRETGDDEPQEDPKDELIAQLRDELAAVRLELADVEQERDLYRDRCQAADAKDTARAEQQLNNQRATIKAKDVQIQDLQQRLNESLHVRKTQARWRKAAESRYPELETMKP